MAANIVVIVRFSSRLRVPYEDGIEGRLPDLLGDKWRAVADQFPRLSFNRVFGDGPKASPNAGADRVDVEEAEHFFQVEFEDEKEAGRFVDRLKRLRGRLIEEVFVEGEARPPGLPVGVATERRGALPDGQAYLGRAPRGIDAAAAWRLFDTLGAGVSVADVETGWYFDHPDLPRGLHQICGLNDHQFDHGASDLGILVARHGGPRTNGAAPEARVLAASYVQSERLRS